MKKQLLKFSMISFLFAAPMMLSAQTVLLNENFSSGSMPAGWSQDSAGVTPFYPWTFTNPGARVITGANFDSLFVIFDSDHDGSGNSQDVYLNLPTVNASALTSLFLVMDEQYRDYINGYHQIEISTNGGSSWTGIVSDTDATDRGYPNPAVHSTYDISTLAAGRANVRVRFHYAGTFAWWWAIDNVLIEDALALPPPPSNDACANATPLTVGSTCSTTSFNMGTATNSGMPGCNGAVADDDVWFSFVATDVSCIVQLNSLGLHHTIEVYDGCGGSSIACLSPGTASILSLFSGLTVGNTYYLEVYTDGAAVGDLATQDICLISPPPPPANDECADAVLLTVDVTCNPTAGTLGGATNSGVAPCTGTADDDVWYAFVANDTVASIQVTGQGLNNPVIELFDGCGGTSVNCFNANGSTSESGLARGLTVGLLYYFRVYSYGANVLDNSSYDFNVCVVNVTFPANDDCGGAIEIIPGIAEWDCNSNTLVATDLATGSVPAPSCSSVNYLDDVWYYFVANNTTMTMEAFNLSAGLAAAGGIGFVLYDGSCGGTELFCQNPPTPSTRYTYLNYVIGNTYYLRTFTANLGTTGTYNLCVYGGIFTGVPETNPLLALRIYPNPSTGLLNISGTIHESKIAIRVYDMIGNMVGEKILHYSDKAEMDISTLSNGIYYVKIENGTESSIQKIVLNK